MRALKLFFPAWLLLLPALLPPATAGAVEAPADIEVFIREGCPHCEEVEKFLDALIRERPLLKVVRRDVRQDPAALERLKELAAAHAIQAPGVPAFYLRGELVIGYAGAAATGAHLRSLLDRVRPHGAASVSEAGSCPAEDTVICGPERPAAPATAGTVDVPFFGMRLNIDELGLPLFTFLLGLLDGLNPCSMWVLIFMISMLASLRDRVKMLVVAGTFVAIEGIAYFAFMAAWLNLFLVIGASRASEIALGLIAGVAGAINVKDFWAFGRGVSLSIPQSAKPGIYARVRSILQAENLAVAVMGTAVLAVLVQAVEFMCTSGFPALYTRILTLRQLEGWAYYGYLLIYKAAYMLDDAIVLTIGVITLSQRRLQEKEGRWLKLVSGVVMLGLGVYLIVLPH